MKKEKDIAEFFNQYSNELLPNDKEAFMQRLKDNIDRLPVPSGFEKMDAEASKAYCEWLLEKMKADYRRKKKEAVITCAFACVLAAVILLISSALGLFAISTWVSTLVLVVIAALLIGFIYSMLAPITKF